MKKEYGIRELSELAGVSARTLRYYDEIGLLKPRYVSEAGYRFYGEQEVAVLQQILFYRERGFDLKRIRQILYQEDFDLMNALEAHLLALEEQRHRTEALIQTVRQTIKSMRGECDMSDRKKFEAFKKRMVEENDAQYGAESREAYGEAQVEASNRKLLGMSEAEWERFQKLEAGIREGLLEAVTRGDDPESEKGKALAALHKEWLLMTWSQYSAEAHKGLAAMYIADERFRAYYDREAEGCAAFLEASIRCWADRI